MISEKEYYKALKTLKVHEAPIELNQNILEQCGLINQTHNPNLLKKKSELTYALACIVLLTVITVTFWISPTENGDTTRIIGTNTKLLVRQISNNTISAIYIQQ